eukprot:761735-Hanusia_phi.AAC.4
MSPYLSGNEKSKDWRASLIREQTNTVFFAIRMLTIVLESSFALITSPKKTSLGSPLSTSCLIACPVLEFTEKVLSSESSTNWFSTLQAP